MHAKQWKTRTTNLGIFIIKIPIFEGFKGRRNFGDIVLLERAVFKTTQKIKIPILFQIMFMHTNKKSKMELCHPINSCWFLDDVSVVFIFLIFVLIIPKMSTK